MNNSFESSAKKLAPYAVFGTMAALVLATPVAWGALGYGLFRLGKRFYQEAESQANVPTLPQEDLFL